MDILDAYNKIPEVKGIVNRIQDKYKLRDKENPDYNEKNAPAATEEIKRAVAPLIKKYESELETKAKDSSGDSKLAQIASSGSQMKAAAGLIITAGLVALAATTGVYIPPIYL